MGVHPTGSSSRRRGRTGTVRRLAASRTSRLVAAVVAVILAGLGVPGLASQAVAASKPKPVTNPDLDAACGLDVVLVLDASTSIQQRSGAETAVREAATTFVDAFTDTSTRVGIVEFGTTARPLTDMAPVTTASATGNGAHAKAIRDYDAPSSPIATTNWQDAGVKADEMFTRGGDRGVPRLLVFVTDGAPNTINRPGGGTTRPGPGQTYDPTDAALEPAIEAMNVIKNRGIHMLTVGVGDAFSSGSAGDVRKEMLQRVTDPSPQTYSGSGAFDPRTTDIVMVQEFEDLAEDLRRVAEAICDGSLSITKHTSTQDDPDTYSNGGAGWEFNTVVTPAGDWVVPNPGGGDGRAQTTDSSGSVVFQWDGGTPSWTKDATVIETARDDYTLDRVECSVNGGKPEEHAVTEVYAGFSFDVAVGAGKQVACDVYNKFTGKGWTDVGVTKTVSAPVVTVGETVTWTVSATNHGPKATANQVVVTDTLPAGVTLVPGSAVTSAGTFDESTGEWSVPTIAKGATETLQISTKVDAAGTHKNVAELTGLAEDDTNPKNDKGTATVKGVEANLTITKDARVEEQLLGGEVVWDVVVTNGGPATAKDVEVEDVVSAGLELVSATPSRGTFTAGVWSVGDLAEGESASLVVVTKATSTGVQTNEVEATTSTPESDYDDNFAEDDVQITAADVTVSKKVSKSVVGAGDEVTWTIVAKNEGDATAFDVVVTDDLPAGLTYVSSSPDGAYDRATGEWTIGELAPGASATLTITTKVDAAATIENVACISTTTVETDDDNSCASDEVTGVPTNVTVSKRPDVSEVFINGEVVWTVTATNDSPADAVGVVVTDTLPEGLTIVDVVGASQGTVSADGKVWTVGTLARDGGSATLQLRTRVWDREGLLTNRVDVETETPEDDTDDNWDTADVDVVAADLAITKTAHADTVVLGDTVTWTIQVTNSGTAAAHDVVVSDDLPLGLDRSDVVTVPADALVDGKWVVGTLAANGGSATLEVTTTTTGTGGIENTACVTTSTPQKGQDERCGSDDVVVTVADVSVEKTADVRTTTLGETVVWTITVSNSGTAAAHDVVVTDHLPAGLEIDSYEVSQGGFDTESGAWTVGTLPAGQGQATLTVTTTTTTTGQVENQACVDTSTTDVGDLPLCAADRVEVTAPDLVVEKTAGADEVYVGGSLDWTITVSNLGDASAHDVVVTDTVPAGLTVQSVEEPSQGGFDLGTATWTVGDLAPGESATLTLSTAVDAAGELTNTACVESPTPESDTANNCGEDTTTGVEADGLEIEKINTPEGEVRIGDRIDYTLRVTVPASATLPHDGVTVTDTLPGHDADRPQSGSVTYVDGSATCADVRTDHGRTCDVSLVTDGSGTVTQVTWGLGRVLPGQSVDVTFAVTADDQTDGEEETIDILNAGRVSSAYTDPVESDEVVNVLVLTEVLDERIPGPADPPGDDPSPRTAPPVDPRSPADPPTLSHTGIDLARQLSVALTLLLVGAAVTRVARRRATA